ncbi:EXLDI protein [Luteococcus peritonei]|uniref:EXLDI protein n=1 Tax=Luteococcus peritonei TaxID=88874 RepID=A0ABW4RVG2_9ACTN
MGRRNIYVQAGQEGLYEEAALLAGSLSAAVEQGLQLFLAQRRGGLRFDEVEVVVGRGSHRITKRFRARELVEVLVEPRHPGRHSGVTVHQTARDRLAVWCWSDPDWSALRSGALSNWSGPLGRSDPVSGSGLDEDIERDDQGWFDWGDRQGDELLVFETVDELLAAVTLPQVAVDKLRACYRPTPLEVLDI